MTHKTPLKSHSFHSMPPNLAPKTKLITPLAGWLASWLAGWLAGSSDTSYYHFRLHPPTPEVRDPRILPYHRGGLWQKTHSQISISRAYMTYHTNPHLSTTTLQSTLTLTLIQTQP